MATLNVLPNFVATLLENDRTLVQGGTVKVSELHCSVCGALRKMLLRTLYRKTERTFLNPNLDVAEQLTPSLHYLVCVQCEMRFTALIFQGPQGSELAIFPNKPGGLATQNTPVEVGYYLEQAWRCQCVGALSAAVVMYRAALEHLLRGQGYAKGSLADRINKLGEAVDAGNGPDWVRSTPPQLLHALRELGNGAVHTNDGDVSKQATFDSDLLEILSAVIRGLLEEVYERPERNKETLNRLQAAAKVFEKKTK